MLIHHNHKNKKVETNRTICPFHQLNPGEDYAGCGCSASYILKEDSSKEESGFEDEPEEKMCNHPSHHPPRHLCIPHGKIYRHVCPACGYTIRISGSKVRF